jgi:hypothetical protein
MPREDEYTGDDEHYNANRSNQLSEDSEEDSFFDEEAYNIKLNDNDSKLLDKLTTNDLDYETLSDEDKDTVDSLKHLLGIKTKTLEYH